MTAFTVRPSDSLVVADGSAAGVQKFRRLCEQCYRLFQERMAEEIT